MNTVQLKYSWLSDVLPEGWPYPSSTVLSGPMGAGKPLIAGAFLSSWLQNGGSIISMPLQFPDPAFTTQNMKDLYHFDMNKYQEQMVFVSFNPEIDGVHQQKERHLEADLVIPENWYEVIRQSKALLPSDDGILLFSTAINLPLVADRYADPLLEMFHQLFTDPSGMSYLFALSTSMVNDRAGQVTEMADNLVDGYISRDNKLRFEILRMKGVEFRKGEQQVPFGARNLQDAEERAKKYRVAPVHLIKKRYNL